MCGSAKHFRRLCVGDPSGLDASVKGQIHFVYRFLGILRFHLVLQVSNPVEVPVVAIVACVSPLDDFFFSDFHCFPDGLST